MAKKSEQVRFAPRLIAVAVASCFATGPALANPTNPTVVHGSAVFSNPAPHVLNVQTLTPQTIINWGGFSISVGELTRFVQPSALSAVLNRVVGQDPSSILGALQSNGRVFLINPNGIVFGPSAQIDVAGLVASTLNLSNEDFLAGRLRFTEVAGAGTLLNQGTIGTAAGGHVYLVGPAVTNAGIIMSPQGEVVLAAGNRVELVNPGTPNLRVEIAAPDNEAVNLGQIVAESGRIGIYAGLVRNSGAIRADSAVAEGGRILLKATQNVTLEPASELNASGIGGGRIEVLAEDTARIAGRLDASAPNGGDGGFIETSGKNRVTVAEGTVVTTAAPFGRTGLWLIDPTDFTIAASGGDITGGELSINLDSTNVIITSDQGSSGINGDIFVNDTVSWDSANSLSLVARRNVVVNQDITNSGSGDINLYAGWDGVSSPSTPAIAPNTGTVFVTNATVETGGNVRFHAGLDISVLESTVHAGFGRPEGNRSVIFDAGRAISVVASTIKATTDHLTTMDSTSLISFSAAGDIGVTNNSLLEAGVGDYPARQANVELMSTGGNIEVSGGSRLRAWGFQGDTVSDEPPGLVILHAQGTGKTITLSNATVTASGRDAAIFMGAPGGITINNESYLVATSLSGNDGSARIWGCAGTASDGPLCEPSAAGPIIITNNSSLFASGNIGVFGAARIDLIAGGYITVQSGATMEASGGESLDGNGGPATVALNAAGGITVNYASVSATGGGSLDGNGGPATVALNAAGGITVNNASVSATGGGSLDGNGGPATVALNAAGGITVNNASVSATGGGSLDGNGGPATVALNASGGIMVENAFVQASGGEGNYGGPATVALSTTGNDIELGGNTILRADGGEGALLKLTAANGGIFRTWADSSLQASSVNPFPRIELIASNGIGTLDSPLRIENSSGPDIVALNTGPSGDIALSFVARDPGCGASTTHLCMSDDFVGIFNANLSGTYYARSETGGIELNIPFVPVGTGPLAGQSGLLPEQSVILEAPSGSIILGQAGSRFGSIRAGHSGGMGNVQLIARDNIVIGGDSYVTGFGPLLRANDIQIANNGFVRSRGGLINIREFSNGPIHLGGTPVTGTMNLSNTELNNMTGWDGTSDPLTSGMRGGLAIGDISSGPIVFKGPIGPTNAFLNLSGSTITQDVGAAVTGSLNVAAPGGVTLNEPTNQIDFFTADWWNNGAINVVTASPIELYSVATNNASVSVQSSGTIKLGLPTASGTAVNAGTGAVTLTSTGGAIVDGGSGLDILASSASLTAAAGIGSIANPIETRVGSLALSSGAGEIGIVNDGSLTLSSLSFAGTNAAIYASTQFGAGSATLALGSNIAVSGNLSLLADTGMTINRNVTATGSLVLDAGGGTLAVVPQSGGTTVNAGASMALAGANVSLGTPSQTSSLNVVAGNGMQITTPGNLTVAGGNGGYTFVRADGGNMAISAGGNVTVTGGSSGGYAHVLGTPDLSMTVGGTVQMNATDPSAPARIESASLNTISLAFPNLASGGYFVNGQEGVVADPQLGTGFYANGLPAVLGVNLLVSYGGAPATPPPSTVESSINQVIVAINQQIEITETAGTQGEGPEAQEEEKKKKELPVCR